MLNLLTGDGVGWVWGPVLWVVALLVTVLHLQSHRVSSGQLRSQVSAAFSISSQTGYDLPHRVLPGPETRHRNYNQRQTKITFNL